MSSPITVVIPARYDSQRLPGKVLLAAGGKPILQHVYELACRSAAQRVVIACDDERVADAARGFGAEVLISAVEHGSGTERVQETVQRLGLPEEAVVVNVQGDEPLLPARLIDALAEALIADPELGMATVADRLSEVAMLFDPNVVKVVVDDRGRALYFSRAPIPWDREAFGAGQPAHVGSGWYRHVGIYAYRPALLRQWVHWSPSPLERIEALEQLRALHHGVPIGVIVSDTPVPHGVDTEAQLQAVREVLGDS